MGVLCFPVFPKSPASTECRCDMAGNLSRQNGTGKEVSFSVLTMNGGFVRGITKIIIKEKQNGTTATA